VKNRANTGATGEKKPNRNGWAFDEWWWSAVVGSNPISKALRQVYASCLGFWGLSILDCENTNPIKALN
jgi:hypothetical protein